VQHQINDPRSCLSIYPTLEDKVDIVQNAINRAHAVGSSQPLSSLLMGCQPQTLHQGRSTGCLAPPPVEGREEIPHVTT
jgi:hypothetical protein